MTFFERYEKLCTERGFKPTSTQAAELLGLNKGTISAWKKTGNPPTTDVLVVVADAYGVSTDYLLGRTEDPLDYTNSELVAKAAEIMSVDGETGIKKAIALQRAIAEKNSADEATQPLVSMYIQLDDADKGKVEAFIQGLLLNEKYSVGRKSRKKHA